MIYLLSTQDKDGIITVLSEGKCFRDIFEKMTLPLTQVTIWSESKVDGSFLVSFDDGDLRYLISGSD